MKDGEIKLLIEKRSETTLFKIIWAHVKKKKKVYNKKYNNDTCHSYKGGEVRKSSLLQILI